jgi:hypothetical protein
MIIPCWGKITSIIGFRAYPPVLGRPPAFFSVLNDSATVCHFTDS